MSEKLDILDETGDIIWSDDMLSPMYLIKIFVIIALVLAIAFPKIFINSQIYYKSRNISNLTREHDILKEENRLIKAKVEELKFKNEVLDTMF